PTNPPEFRLRLGAARRRQVRRSRVHPVLNTPNPHRPVVVHRIDRLVGVPTPTARVRSPRRRRPSVFYVEVVPAIVVPIVIRAVPGGRKPPLLRIEVINRRYPLIASIRRYRELFGYCFSSAPVRLSKARVRYADGAPRR